MNTQPAMSIWCYVSQYTIHMPVGLDPMNDALFDIQIDRAVQLDGQIWWAVRWMGRCLKTGRDEWTYEPIPSERSDEWLTEHRFTCLDVALAAAKRMVPTLRVNGRTARECV